MDGRILYEQHFPRDEEDEFDTLLKDIALYGNREEVRVLVPLTERRDKVERFVQRAVDTSYYYETDVEIVQYDCRISAKYTVYDEHAGSLGAFIDLLNLADDFNFEPGVDEKNNPVVFVTADYYTHAEYKNGRHVAPQDYREGISNEK